MAFERQGLPQLFDFEGKKLKVDHDGFVSLGDVARSVLNTQNQYIGRYADGLDQDRPKLSDGLRFASMISSRTGQATGNEYEYRIYMDDVAEFVRRVREHKAQ